MSADADPSGQAWQRKALVGRFNLLTDGGLGVAVDWTSSPRADDLITIDEEAATESGITISQILQ